MMSTRRSGTTGRRRTTTPSLGTRPRRTRTATRNPESPLRTKVRAPVLLPFAAPAVARAVARAMARAVAKRGRPVHASPSGEPPQRGRVLGVALRRPQDAPPAHGGVTAMAEASRSDSDAAVDNDAEVMP